MQLTTVIFDLGGGLADINDDYAPSLLARVLGVPTARVVGLLAELSGIVYREPDQLRRDLLVVLPNV